MKVNRATLILMVLLLTARKSRSNIISRPYSIPNARGDTRDIVQSFGRVVPNDCGDRTVLQKHVWQCVGDLYQLTGNGYPWTPHRNQRNFKDNLNNIRDALDSLNYACLTFDRSQRCLLEHGISDYCLATTRYWHMNIYFSFICHHRQRDENLARSLQCLHYKRVMVMLYFHIAQRCRGSGILDNIPRQYYKHAYFNTREFMWNSTIPCLLCLPRTVISACVKDCVEDLCGVMTAEFAHDYLLYLRDWFGRVLEYFGLNICGEGISAAMVPTGSTTTPGTALGTISGRYLLAALHNLPGENVCTTESVYTSYTGCVAPLDSKSENSQFNILQFAHQLLPLVYYGTNCDSDRLKEFKNCWTDLREMCGPKVRGLYQHATLLMEGCKIQSEMDTIGCPWQEMLLPHYIEASRVTVWPMVIQCLHNPMSLESSHCSSVDSVLHDLDTVILLLQPGVDAISRECGSQHANRLRTLLHKLRFLQRYALEYLDLSYGSVLYQTN